MRNLTLKIQVLDFEIIKNVMHLKTFWWFRRITSTFLLQKLIKENCDPIDFQNRLADLASDRNEKPCLKFSRFLTWKQKWSRFVSLYVSKFILKYIYAGFKVLYLTVNIKVNLINICHKHYISKCYCMYWV